MRRLERLRRGHRHRWLSCPAPWLSRYDTRPESALEALMLERRSLCLNPRGGLIAGKRLDELITVERPEIAAAFEERLRPHPICVYEVERIWLPRTVDPERFARCTETSVLSGQEPAPSASRW